MSMAKAPAAPSGQICKNCNKPFLFPQDLNAVFQFPVQPMSLV